MRVEISEGYFRVVYFETESDLLDPTYGLDNFRDEDGFVTAEVASESEEFLEIGIMLSDDEGITLMFPNVEWVPAEVRAWIKETTEG